MISMLGGSEFRLRQGFRHRRKRLYAPPGADGGAVEICHILGRDEALKRIQLGIDKLS